MGGYFIVETPNADDALLTLYGSEEFKKFSYWGCHVQLYTSNTLESILKKSGFEVILNKQIQRYPLSNHIYWLSKGKPGGHRVWKDLSNSIIDVEYERLLQNRGLCDTLFFVVQKKEKQVTK